MNPDKFFPNELRPDKNELAFINNYGAKGDGKTDDSKAFQKAINSFSGKNGTIVLDSTKTYCIKSTIVVPYNVSIDGNLARIRPLSGGTLTGGYLFYINSTLSNTTVQSWGGEVVATISNLRLENPSQIANVKGFYTRGKTNFKNITFNGFYKGILKDGNSDQDYSDMIHLDKLYFVNCLGTEALVDIKYNGDGLLVNQCHVAGSGDKNYNFLNLEFCNGGTISNCINGDIRINKSMAVSIENNHCEHGKITIISSQVSLKDGYHWYHKDYQPIPITIINAAADKPTMPCIIENYSIIHLKDRQNLAKNYTDPDYFDAYFKNANVKITNFFRRSVMHKDNSIGMNTGVKLTLDGTTLFEDWENASQLFSKNSYISDKNIFTYINESNFPNNFVLYEVAAPNHTSFDEAVGTYYYQIVYFFGFEDRLVGKWGGGEQSVTITNKSNQVPYLNVQYQPDLQLSKARIYRGTSPGQYTHYVDVPIGNGLGLYDYGYFVSTGERWKTRTAGSVDHFNSTYTRSRLFGTNQIVYGTATPTRGSWKKGDTVTNNSKTELGTAGSKYIVDGWECVAAGTPGTWIEKRSLTGN